MGGCGQSAEQNGQKRVTCMWEETVRACMCVHVCVPMDMKTACRGCGFGGMGCGVVAARGVGLWRYEVRGGLCCACAHLVAGKPMDMTVATSRSAGFSTMPSAITLRGEGGAGRGGGAGQAKELVQEAGGVGGRGEGGRRANERVGVGVPHMHGSGCGCGSVRSWLGGGSVCVCAHNRTVNANMPRAARCICFLEAMA